jgi:hypothetical protein
MNIIPNQNFEFDDAATLAMGEAFRQCLQRPSAVSEH